MHMECLVPLLASSALFDWHALVAGHDRAFAVGFWVRSYQARYVRLSRSGQGC
jgi:hypothetical protein